MIDLTLAQKIQDWHDDCIKITGKNPNVDYRGLSKELWLYICTLTVLLESGVLKGLNDCTDIVNEYVEFVEQRTSEKIN